MKGIAVFIWLILATSLLIAGITGITYLKTGGLTNPSGKDPVAIGASAVEHLPVKDLKDYFLGGLFGIIIWLNTYVIQPFVGWIISAFVGHPVEVHPIIGYAMTALILLSIFIGLWNRIWDFVHDNWIRALMVVILIVGIGIALVFAGVI